MAHFSEVGTFDASGIEPGKEENYLWFKHNGIYYPDLETYRSDPYPENYRELAEQTLLDDLKNETYEI